MTPRGAFIVFEGLDRCGKTTQVEQLAQAMRREGREVRCMKFPGELRRERTLLRVTA
jgi:dTMP kinase